MAGFGLLACLPLAGIGLGMALLPKAELEAPRAPPVIAIEPRPAPAVNRDHKRDRLVSFSMPDNPAAKGTYPGLDAFNALNAIEPPASVERDPEPTSVVRPHHRANNETCRRVGRRQVWHGRSWRCQR